MKKNFLLLGLGIIIVGFVFSVASERGGRTLYENKELGLSFLYRGGEKGYIVKEYGGEGNDSAQFIKSIVVINEEANEELERSSDGREGPPTITISIFKEKEGVTLEQWIATEQVSNFQLATSPLTPTTLGWHSGFQYTADGLYPSKNVAVLFNGKIYLFSGMYLAPEDEIRFDFEKLLKTVQFI